MAAEIKFICNICNESFVTFDMKCKITTGWGVVTPTLKVKMPSFPDKKKDRSAYWEFDKLKIKLKQQLQERAYHICHKCLQTHQGKILKISE